MLCDHDPLRPDAIQEREALRLELGGRHALTGYPKRRRLSSLTNRVLFMFDRARIAGSVALLGFTEYSEGQNSNCGLPSARRGRGVRSESGIRG